MFNAAEIAAQALIIVWSDKQTDHPAMSSVMLTDGPPEPGGGGDLCWSCALCTDNLITPNGTRNRSYNVLKANTKWM